MAKIFFDTNVFIDAIHRKTTNRILNKLEGHSIYISPLSVHIYCYAFKIKIPKDIIKVQVEDFELIEFSDIIVTKALEGPTHDFEDNVQLHTAAEAECDLLFTEDKNLLNIKFFGKVKITSPQSLNSE